MASKIQIAQPSTIFKPYIRYYKYIECDISGIMKVIPNTSIELYFNYTHINLFSEPNYDLDNPLIHLSGYHSYYQTIYSHMHGTDRGGGFAIVFQPRGFFDLFGIKCADFCKYIIHGESVLKKDIYRLWEKLRSFWNVDDMKNIVESHLACHAKQANREVQFINSVVQYIDKNGGMVRVSQLCNTFNTTPRTMERRIKEEIGLSPKELLQVFRINKAVRMIIEQPDDDLTHIGYMCGYYDQSHFIREIKRIANIIPGDIQSHKSVKGVPLHNLLFLHKE